MAGKGKKKTAGTKAAAKGKGGKSKAQRG